MNHVKIYQGDVRKVLRKLPANSVHCAITSPPYWGYRNYQGGAAEIGQEKTVEEYIENLVSVFRELQRVLREDATFWLNIGVKPKKNLGIPHRLVFALQADGWLWADEIIWHSPSKMPESVTDRTSNSHEFIFLLTKSTDYFFDHVAIREPAKSQPHSRKIKKAYSENRNELPEHNSKIWGAEGLANKRSVWTVSPEGTKAAHFAAFPRKLILPCILAGTSQKGCCSVCGAPYTREIKKGRQATRPAHRSKTHIDPEESPYKKHSGTIIGNRDPQRHVTVVKTTGWRPGCGCGAAIAPCITLDPFGGTGTIAAASLENGRDSIAIELNPDYVKLIQAKVKKAHSKKGFILT